MKINKNLSVAFFIISAGAILWWYNRPYPPKENLTSRQEANVEKMLKEMKTRCVGRYLIDLPASFLPYRNSQRLEDPDSWDTTINMSDDDRRRRTFISTKRMYYPAFLQFIQRREKELRNETVVEPQDGPYLKKVWKLPDGLKGIMFQRNESLITPDAVQIIESYLYTNGVAIKLLKRTYNDSSPRYEKERDGDPIQNFVVRDIDRMNNLLSRITGRQEDEIPKIPGSCVADAFIATDKYAQEQEDIYRNYLSDEVRGLKVSLNMDNFTKGSDSVLQRTGQIEHDLAQVNGRIVRKGAFDVNGLYVEEMLMMAPQPPDSKPRYSFGLYINEKATSYNNPELTVELNNFPQTPLPYSQEELIAFWDAITQTIRLRPNAF